LHFTWLCWCLFCCAFCRMTVTFDIAFLTFLHYFSHLITVFRLLSQCYVAVLDCCICRKGQRVRVPLSLRLYRYYFSTDIFLNKLSFTRRRTSILTDIRLELLSFCIVCWCPLRTCTVLLSHFSFIFLLLCWSFGTNWRAQWRYCRCVGGSVDPWPSITVPNSVALCGGHDSLVSTDVVSRSQSEPDSEAPIFAVLHSSSGNWRCPRHRLGES